VLLRRLRDLAQVYPLEVNAPIRRHGSGFFSREGVEKAVGLARMQATDGILLLVDGDLDDNCPKVDGPQILAWAVPPAAGTPCVVVMAYREYESWFLASVESLRGQRGIRDDAQSHPNPEQPRGAKEHLEARMEPGRSYSETADQPALSAVFDLESSYKRCPSFRHLVKAFRNLITAGGLAPGIAFPPAAWQAE
jgi:hypothetical protein